MSFFFFKQKTAYEMRISDWSSDVCSSDLPFAQDGRRGGRQPGVERTLAPQMGYMRGANHDLGGHAPHVDAGAAADATLDQGDAGTAFHCLEGGRRGGGAAAAGGNGTRLLLR